MCLHLTPRDLAMIYDRRTCPFKLYYRYLILIDRGRMYGTDVQSGTWARVPEA